MDPRYIRDLLQDYLVQEVAKELGFDVPKWLHSPNIEEGEAIVWDYIVTFDGVVRLAQNQEIPCHQLIQWDKGLARF